MRERRGDGVVGCEGWRVCEGMRECGGDGVWGVRSGSVWMWGGCGVRGWGCVEVKGGGGV